MKVALSAPGMLKQVFTRIQFVINDPLGQTNSSTSSDNYSPLKFVLFGKILSRTEVQTPCVIIVITTGRDCGLAEWINTSGSGRCLESRKLNIFPSTKKRHSLYIGLPWLMTDNFLSGS